MMIIIVLFLHHHYATTRTFCFFRSFTHASYLFVWRPAQNRELQIMRLLSHPNIVQLKNSFFTNGDKVCS